MDCYVLTHFRDCIVIISSEPLSEPDNRITGDFIALLSGVPYGTSDKIYYNNTSDFIKYRCPSDSPTVPIISIQLLSDTSIYKANGILFDR